jgi:hypothetical protein
MRTYGLMLALLFPDALGLAHLIGRALDYGILAFGIVELCFLVGKDFVAAEVIVGALELHLLQLLLHLLLDRDEARLLALHWTLASLAAELIQTTLVEPILALFALHWVHKDGMTEDTEQVLLDLCVGEHVTGVH